MIGAEGSQVDLAVVKDWVGQMGLQKEWTYAQKFNEVG
jgi:hypothetical protein